ncbi:MAG: hypothetical protein AAFP19_02565 [Bacteroidota bacterium]
MSEKKWPNKVESYEQLVQLEDIALVERRKKLFGEEQDLEELEATRFGIALSGGGIRSATINLGLLKTLNKFGLLKRADYLSTVSGGGYTGAYVQATLKKEGQCEKLFAEKHIDYIRSRGEYLMPGKGWEKTWNILVLMVGYLASLLMSWISPIIVLLLVYAAYILFIGTVEFDGFGSIGARLEEIGLRSYGMMLLVGIFITHVLANIFMKFQLGVSRKFNNLESALLLIVLVWMLVLTVLQWEKPAPIGDYPLISLFAFIVAVFLLGFIADPNALSLHRFYRAQLADAFLSFTEEYKNVSLAHLFDTKSTLEKDYLAPYPLINTCLNLQASNDKNFKGTKANDYFLLSPLYCGAKLTDYVRTAETGDYQRMTLPAAITISAAAVNPGMGMYSNKLLSIFMTLLNARLGFWVDNPLKDKRRSWVWWPSYFFRELSSRIGTNNSKLNISDGGHIENLGVYELLRRKCRLIIAVDAGADPEYTFGDLENLTIRARNELGVEIRFREGQEPENLIRPLPSNGYSKQRYVVADIIQLWEEIFPRDTEGELICDTQGKPVEVLINYKTIHDKFAQLNEDERLQIVGVLESLELQTYSQQAIGMLDSKEEVTNILASLQVSTHLEQVLRSLISLFDKVKATVRQKLANKLGDKSKEDLALAQIIRSIDKRVRNQLKVGTLVYVKSSIVAPEKKLIIEDKESLEYKTYKYKVYHPNFPHEPTSDQFFDEVQWESYYRLGQFMGAEVLGAQQLPSYLSGKKEAPQFTIRELLSRFDEGRDIFLEPTVLEPTLEVEATPLEMAMAPPEEAMSQPEEAPPEDYAEATPLEEEQMPAAEAPKKVDKIVIGGGEDEYCI